MPTASTPSSPGEDAVNGGQIATVSQVPVGGALAVQAADGSDVLLTQPEAGQIHAFSAVCTHQGCIVAPGDGELACPCHQSSFDLTSGAVLGGPAPGPLAEVAVVVQEGGIVLLE